MEEKQDKEDLRKKVVNMFNVIAIEKYGFPKLLTNKNRDRWDKVLACANTCSKVATKFNLSFDFVKESALNVIKDHPEFLPSPMMFEGEILRKVNLSKKQNTKVDSEFVEASKMSLLREKKRTEIQEVYGAKIREKMEQSYYFIHPDKCLYDDKTRKPLAFWFFYEALVRQDQDAIDILDLYEKNN